MSIPTPFNPMGTLGAVKLGAGLRMPTGVAFDGLVFPAGFFSKDIEFEVEYTQETFVWNSVQDNGWSPIICGGWLTSGSFFFNVRHQNLQTNMFLLALVYRDASEWRTYGPWTTDQLPVAVCVHLNRSGYVVYVNGRKEQTLQREASLSRLSDRPVTVMSFSTSRANSYTIHALSALSSAGSVSLVPAKRGAEAGVFDEISGVFTPIPGAVFLQ